MEAEHRSQRPTTASQSMSHHRALPLFLSSLGSVAVWLALPPVGCWPLAWIAAIPWALLVAWAPNSHSPVATEMSATNISRRSKLCNLLAGKKSDHRWRLQVWLGGFLFWLGTLYFLPLPHPALWIAWPLLAGYLALWHLFAIGSARMLVQRWHWPLVWALPVAWASAEWLRSWVITGFAMALVGHSQYQLPIAIQLADLGGAYLVSFAIILFGTAAACMVITKSAPRRWGSLFTAIATITTVILYGQFRLIKSEETPDTPQVIAAIIQGSIDTEFPDSVEEAHRVFQNQWDQYQSLSQQARMFYPEAQLLIWPETAFLQPDYISDPQEQQLSENDQRHLAEARSALTEAWQAVTIAADINQSPQAAANQPIPLLTGIHSINPTTQQYFNAVALIDRPGVISQRYLKNHRVLFGEYIPLANWFPWLDRISPIGKSLSAGRQASVIEFQGLKLLPNICFESTVPHLIRQHVKQAQLDGQPPNILLNLTNDGWFFGTSCLDLHLACNVFRAVEMRCVVWVAANTGLSADIDSIGYIRQVGPRRDTGIMPVVGKQSQFQGSLYLWSGDLIWWLTTLIIVGLWLTPRGTTNSASSDR